MSIIVRVIYEGTTYDLDIQEDIPLRLDVSAIENTEIGETFGVGSQTFNLPGTKNNNNFFKHAYNVGGDDIPAFYNTIDGRIISQGDTLLKGQFQLLEVVKDEVGYVVYKCQMADETVQFKDAIQNKLIKNADWSSYTHTLNTGSIINSWSNNLVGGDVYYPLAHYGYNDPESQGSYPTYAFAQPDGTGNILGNFFNNSNTPLQPQQFLPALRARAVINKICEQAGFSATGSFINSGNFSNLMILPKGKEELGIVIENSEQATGFANNLYNQIVEPHPSGAGFTTLDPLAANNIVSDPQNKFFNSGSQGYVYYEADGNGEYEASCQIGFFNPVSFSTAEVEIELFLMRGSFPFSGTVIASQTLNLKSTNGFQTFTMNAGGSWTSTTNEDVFARVAYKTISGTPPNLNLVGISSNLRITKAPEVYNDAQVDMSLQWPSDLKSIDILQGLIQQFNLVVYPSKEQDKTIVFEQFDDWIRSGAPKDWTEKWDTAERTSINHTVDEEPQELILGNQDDSDRFSVEAKESEPYRQYGTLRILADNNISQGSKEVKNAFGPVILGGPLVSGSVTAEGVPTNNIDLGSSFAFPHLYKFDNNQIKSYKFRPRLGYKSNNSFPSGSQYRLALGTGFGDVTLISGSYGTLSNINGLPARDGDADLHFNNTYFKFVGPGLNLGNSTSNFDTYWKTYIDSLYWDGNRKVTLDVKFNSQEFKDLELNDIIFVKDQQYRINKIEGFNLTNDDVATVELIRLYPQYYQNNPDCDFQFTVDEMECDFSFEAIDIGGTTPTPTPSPTPAVCKLTTITCVASNGCTGLGYIDCAGNAQSTGYQPFNTTITACAFTTNNQPGDGYQVSAATDPSCQSPTPTPSPTPTLPPGPTPTPTPTPTGQTPTPTPSPTPSVFSYTGTAGYANYQAACSGSEVTIYTRGEIGTGSIAYEDASLTNVFDFNRFFVDGQTGIGYEFVDPNTTGEVIDTLDDACNVEIFRLFIDFNEYDACAETVVNTVYAAPGDVIENGTILYEDINLEYSWYGQTSTEIKFIESGSASRQIYYNTATGVSQSGTDVCFEVNFFSASDFTATTPPSIFCGDYEKFLYTEGTPQIGSIIYTDDDLTDPIFTGNNWVYNASLDILYHMSGSTTGDGTGWVIGEITSSYCTPPTPTPSPTPATIVTEMSVSASWSSYYDACTNAGFTGTLYKADIWNGIAPAGYETFFYEDSNLTNIFDFYQYVVDTSNGDGYQLPDPNTTGKVISTGSDVCTISSFTNYITFNQYDACSQTISDTVYVAGNHTTMSAGLELFDNPELSDAYDGYDFVVSGSVPLTKWEIVNGVTAVKGICSGSGEFAGVRYTATTPPSPTCGFTERDFYVYLPIGIGSTIYTDSAKTTPLISNYNWVYNNDDNELYRMVSGEISEITSSICTPPTPTPSPTPAPNVFQFSGSWAWNSMNAACQTPTDSGSLYYATEWNGSYYEDFIYTDSGLTNKFTFYLYIVNNDNGDGYTMVDPNTQGKVASTGSAVCSTPTPSPTPGGQTPTPTPTLPPQNRWMILEGELCTQTTSTQYYNWYGDPNYFPSQYMYDANLGWCNDMFYITDGYNSSYPEIDCNASRFEFYNSCSDCQSGINEVTPNCPQPPTPTPTPGPPTPSPTPSPTPAPTATPAPTSAPQWRSFAVYECGTTDTYYFAYYSSLELVDLYNKEFKYSGTCYTIYGEVEYWSSDPIIPSGSFFFDSCQDCQTTL